MKVTINIQPDLAQRCAEIENWRRTGTVSQEGALASFAEKQTHIHPDDRMREAENQTLREGARSIASSISVNEPDAALSKVADAQAILIKATRREIQHSNDGLCPDEVEGYETRDVCCPVCHALVIVEGGDLRQVGVKNVADCLEVSERAARLVISMAEQGTGSQVWARDALEAQFDDLSTESSDVFDLVLELERRDVLNNKSGGYSVKEGEWALAREIESAVKWSASELNAAAVGC